MSRLTLVAAATALLAVPLLAFAQADPQGPPAPDPGEEKINQLIVYGDDPCPESASPNEITVCARKAESERYRIPEQLRGMDNPTDKSWTDRVLAYETVGAAGTNSCSPVGAGGFTGCTQKLIQNAYAEKKDTGAIRFSDLIDKARAKRMSNVDQEAKDTQARVEAEEKAYEALHPGSMTDSDPTKVQSAPAPAAAPAATPPSTPASTPAGAAQ